MIKSIVRQIHNFPNTKLQASKAFEPEACNGGSILVKPLVLVHFTAHLND